MTWDRDGVKAKDLQSSQWETLTFVSDETNDIQKAMYHLTVLM
jgi:hypothetical protein